MKWIKDKLFYWRCELIYFLGGTPNEHIGTLHYRNIESVVANLTKQIADSNPVEGYLPPSQV